MAEKPTETTTRQIAIAAALQEIASLMDIKGWQGMLKAKAYNGVRVHSKLKPNLDQTKLRID